MMKQLWKRVVFTPSIIAISLLQGSLVADEIPREQMEFFEKEVRPLLVQHCFECHSETKQEGGLRLDSRGGLLLGGDSGEAISLDSPHSSLVIDAINYESYEMPPKGKLADREIAILTRWIEIGAPWPGSSDDKPLRKTDRFSEEDRAWWAIQPIRRSTLPASTESSSQWTRNPIDAFIFEKMSSQDLTPAPEANPQDIVRRVYLDVTGLPPTPEQVQAFLENESPKAYEELVDQLLNSKAYGEHSARYWLDLVRYADSDGYRADGFRPHAWRYRDYVIRSFNANIPYDRFVQEQLAGDEMFPDDLDAQVALGYLRHWVYEWNIRDARTQWKTILEDMTDTTSDVFLGLGLQCAKCHNHKFDPLLQKDYLRLQSYLTAIMPRDQVVASEPDKQAYFDALSKWEEQTIALRQQIAEIEKPYREKYRNIAIDRFPEDLQLIARKPQAERTPHDEQLVYLIERQVEAEYERLDQYLSANDKEKVLALRRELKAFEAQKPKDLPVAMLVSDVGSIAPMTVMPKRQEEIVEPGIPSILDPENMPIEQLDKTTGRRTALAKWITSPNNPLSTRVIVNRLWQQHFGRGLAANASDFGRLGGPPSHPELLDWLATELVEKNWSLKEIHRLILTSATYRLSTQHPLLAEYQQKDPLNTFYWRRDTLRMSAEQIRDAFLVVSGQYKECEGGPGQLPDAKCRSVYTRTMRNSPDQLLDSFDLPQFFSSNSNRNTTTTALQSLLMINSDQIYSVARQLSQKVQSVAPEVDAQVILAWKRIFGRSPTPEEIQASVEFITQQQKLVESGGNTQDKVSLPVAKLPYRDGQSVLVSLNSTNERMLVPHDSSLNVEDFTVEVYFQLRSIAKTGAVRTMVAKWNGDMKSPGWRFGVTGEGSRRKPQTLVLQAIGDDADGKLREHAIFSDQHIQINTPYYAAASVKLATKETPGTITFFLKNLSNDDEPLLTAVVEHQLAGALHNDAPITLGSQNSKDGQQFDGLIDDVRLTRKPLGLDELLYTAERDLPDTIGFWRFENVPGVLKNSSADRFSISTSQSNESTQSPQETAFTDWCHALLNSNEFLYIQ